MKVKQLIDFFSVLLTAKRRKVVCLSVVIIVDCDNLHENRVALLLRNDT